MVDTQKTNRVFELLLAKYSFLELTVADLIDILNNSNMINEPTSYYIFLDEVLLNISKEIIKDNSKSKDIIEKYIDSNFNNILNYSKAFLCLKQMSEFITGLELELVPDLFIDIIKDNKKMFEALRVVVDANIDIINSGKLYEIFSNNFIVFIIEIYCELNGIVIDTNNDYEKKDLGYYEYTDNNKRSYDNNEILYFRELDMIPLLTAKEEKELAIKMKQGSKEARDLLITSNLKLVAKIAKRFVGRGLHIMDLIQAGNEALTINVDKFDVEKGCRFSTYATWWIRHGIVRAIEDQARTIRISTYSLNRIKQINEYRGFINLTENREPTIKEIAEKLNISTSEAQLLVNSSEDACSLNICVGENEDTELFEILPSGEESIEDRVYNSAILFDMINKALNDIKITERNKEVIRFRYGLDDGVDRTLDETGKKFGGLTSESIRQIEKRVFEKINAPGIRENFLIYDDFNKPYKNEKTISLETVKPIVVESNEYWFEKLFDHSMYFYHYFSQFIETRIKRLVIAETKYAYSLLSNSEKALIIRIFGKNFSKKTNPLAISSEEKEIFVTQVAPKMVKLIKEIDMNYKKEMVLGTSKILKR